MNDSRLQHATNHLDAAEEHRQKMNQHRAAMNEQLSMAAELIADITSVSAGNDRTAADYAQLYRAGMHIEAAVSCVQGAMSENYEGVKLRGL